MSEHAIDIPTSAVAQPAVTIALTPAEWRDVAAVIDALPTATVDPDGVQALCHELAAHGLFDAA